MPADRAAFLEGLPMRYSKDARLTAQDRFAFRVGW